MANRLVDDVPANLPSGKLGRSEPATAPDAMTPDDHGDRDIFEVPTVVAQVPNLKSTSPNGTGKPETKGAREAARTPDKARPDAARQPGGNGTRTATGKPQTKDRPDAARRPEEKGKRHANGTPEAARTTGGTGERAAKMSDASSPASSPVVKAKRVLPKAAGNRLPSPTQPPRSVPVVAPPMAAAAPRSRVPDPVEEHTEIATPPPPPPTVAASPHRKADVTQVVTPLPPPVEPRQSRGRAPSSRVIVDDPAIAGLTTSSVEPPGATSRPRGKRIGAAVLGGAVLVGAILFVAIGFSTDEVTGASPRSRESGTAASKATLTPPVEAALAPPVSAPEAPLPPAAAPEAEPTPPGSVETTSAAGAPAVPPAGEIAAQAVEEPALDEIEMSPEPSEPSRSERSPPPRPSRVRAKNAQAKATRSSKPLTYDPNALFLKKP